LRSIPALALLLACLALGVSACGDDDDGESGGSEQQVFEVEATDDGVTAPATAKAGAIELRFSNAGKKDHSAQIVRLGEGHTAAEVGEAGQAWGEKGKALPEWIEFAGGIGTTKPGGSGIAVVDLPPGKYAAFDIESDADKPYAEFTVEGDDGAALPEVPARVEATEYAFEAEALESGSQRLRFENVGGEPHHLIGAPLKPGKTEADVKDFLKQEQGGPEGPPPFLEEDSFDTAILSGGESTVVDVRLDSGKYVFLCFIPDRAGGPPHAFKGMASVATVE
jgi:hypothetical protein